MSFVNISLNLILIAITYIAMSDIYDEVRALMFIYKCSCFSRLRHHFVYMMNGAPGVSQVTHAPTGSGSTRPEVKSAPELTRPWVNSA